MALQELTSDEELMSDRCWREFLATKGMQYGFRVLLAQDEAPSASIHGARATRLGPLTVSETEWLEALFPHLVRALSLHGKIARLKTERDALFAYLESLATGILMVDQTGVIHLANAPAEAVLTKGTELVRRDGRLLANDPVAQRELDALILHA